MIFLQPLKKYADFSGRATRQEFWTYYLFLFIIFLFLPIIEMALLGSGLILTILLAVATLVPSWAVSARRLHDTNRSGWMSLITLIPIVGIYIVVLWCFDSDEGENNYGPNLK